jgi:hypothetical protein
LFEGKIQVAGALMDLSWSRHQLAVNHVPALGPRDKTRKGICA